METKIRLNNIQLYGWHGVSDYEKKAGQQFEVDVEILLNFSSKKRPKIHFEYLSIILAK